MNSCVNVRQTGWLTQEHEFQMSILDLQKSLVIGSVTLMAFHSQVANDWSLYLVRLPVCPFPSFSPFLPLEGHDKGK